PRDLHAARAELADAAGHPATAEREPVRAEGVGKDDAGPGLDEVAVDARDDRWIVGVQGLEARAHRDAALDERRAHPAVSEEGAAFEERHELEAVQPATDCPRVLSGGWRTRRPCSCSPRRTRRASRSRSRRSRAGCP